MDGRPGLPDADALTPLRALAAIASAAGADLVAEEAADLAARVAEGRFFVACMGQFKRGKSTVLNALLGESLLPTGVVPVTSVLTIVRYGNAPGASVRYESGPAEEIAVSRLADYVTEDGNPQNAKHVAAVDVRHPSPLLRTGVCLVDTPGLGSASPVATEVTRRFVPRVDAALVVVGADPPLTGDELDLVQQVSAQTPHLMFAINKADKLGNVELAEILLFTQRLLMSRLGAIPEHVFVISAGERLASGRPTRDWGRLEQALRALTEERRAALFADRIERVQTRLARQIRHTLDAAAEVLVAPVDESDRRLRQLQRWQADAEPALADLGVLLGAEQQTIARTLRERLAASMHARRQAIEADLRRAVEPAIEAGGPHAREHALAAAEEAARRALQQELESEEARALAAHREATERFVELANALLDRLAQAEPRLAELPPLSAPAELAGSRRFFFTPMMRLTARTPWQVAVDMVASKAARRERILMQAEAYLDRLLETNTSRVASDLDDRLIDSRRALEGAVRARLTALAGSAARAVERACDVRAAGESAVRAELDRLAALRARLEALRVDAGAARRHGDGRQV